MPFQLWIMDPPNERGIATPCGITAAFDTMDDVAVELERMAKSIHPESRVAIVSINLGPPTNRAERT